jgi:tetrahydrodipicolinate N-succinyltransferase
VLHPHVVVYEDAAVGEDCLLHAGVHVRERCRLGDRVVVQNGAVIGADGFGFVRDRDDQIDAMYTSLFRELLSHMLEDPRNITACTHLLFCAKNIERIGDHATNIAETVYYIVTGRQMPADRPKEDKSHRVVLQGPLDE